ncbi:hypothetical protein F4815DRAFT_450466 [Daldinia loculata]|nr:hypothetical protein F4815DRAFT_450466 [Daldinia loculata]
MENGTGMMSQSLIPFRIQNLDDIKEKSTGGIVVHATNCMGVWGAGFAKKLKEDYPKTFERYIYYISLFKDQKTPDTPPITDTVGKLQPIREKAAKKRSWKIQKKLYNSCEMRLEVNCLPGNINDLEVITGTHLVKI